MPATPGPWQVETDAFTVWNTRDDGGCDAPLVKADTTYRRWGREISRSEHAANLQLIAAAPTLIEALEALLDRYTNLPGEWHPEREEAVIAARAALRLARGE